MPVLIELLEPGSVVDVGCGTGSWLKVFQEHGVADILGLDGEWVDRSLLEIAPEQFRAADLPDDLALGRRFDLALCLEVAHYIPEESAGQLVENLTALAPIALFSAAIPDQGRGLNQQWPDYWAELFRGRGYVCVDCVRPRIWNEPGVETWYAQNALLFVDGELLESRPRLAYEHERAQGRPLSIVHPRLFRTQVRRRSA